MEKEYMIRFKVILDEKENEGATGISAHLDVVGTIDDLAALLGQDGDMNRTIGKMSMRLVREMAKRK